MGPVQQLASLDHPNAVETKSFRTDFELTSLSGAKPAVLHSSCNRSSAAGRGLKPALCSTLPKPPLKRSPRAKLRTQFSTIQPCAQILDCPPVLTCNLLITCCPKLCLAQDKLARYIDSSLSASSPQPVPELIGSICRGPGRVRGNY